MPWKRRAESRQITPRGTAELARASPWCSVIGPAGVRYRPRPTRWSRPALTSRLSACRWIPCSASSLVRTPCRRRASFRVRSRSVPEDMWRSVDTCVLLSTLRHTRLQSGCPRTVPEPSSATVYSRRFLPSARRREPAPFPVWPTVSDDGGSGDSASNPVGDASVTRGRTPVRSHGRPAIELDRPWSRNGVSPGRPIAEAPASFRQWRPPN